jgi:hypothetical protein
MSELYHLGAEGGSETSEPATETKPAARAEHEPAPDTAVSQYEDDAAIEARLDEAGLPTRAEARAAALRPDTDDEDDEDEFSPESDAAIEARLDEAGLPTRAEARAAAREPDAADEDDDYDEDGFGPESDAAIEARLDEADLPTRAESRADALRPDADDEDDSHATHGADLDALTAEDHAADPDEGGRSHTATGEVRVIVQGQYGHDWPLTVMHLDPEDRTVGDDTLTGIGLKPTGDQLRNIESDKLSRGDRLRRNVYERVDDFRDASEKNAGALEGFLGSHRPTGHDVVHTTQRAIEAPQPPPADAGNIATAGLVLGLLADRAIHQAREWLRRSKG